MARLGHPTGERGIAQGISKFGALQLVSNSASMTPEQIVEGCVPGQIFGWQVYVDTVRKKSEAMITRINKMPDKYKYIILTLDLPVAGKREADERASMEKVRKFDASGNSVVAGSTAGLFGPAAKDLTWDETLRWLTQWTKLPIILKGVQTWEDAFLASQHAPIVKGIIVSNHGGRAIDTAPTPVHVLLEIRKYCPEIFDKIEVWVDGGIRRGTDIIKALCLGAKAVGIGRAPLWGLAAGGPEGVERTFESKRSSCGR
jgi:isopentenyl diphosphate isomerase/L-lactate dehydrogenase-like FMN-dependent dehydrogenase